MIDDVPDMITLDYIRENVTDDDFKQYVDNEHEKIIESFDMEQRTEVCLLLGSTLMHNLDFHSKDEITRRTLKKIVEISKIGINCISDSVNKGQYAIDHIYNSDNEASLLAIIGKSLIYLDRPIAAMEYLDRAEKLFELLSLTGIGPSNIWCVVNYEHCRAHETLVYSLLGSLMDGEKRLLFETCADSYCTHALINLLMFGGHEEIVHHQEDCKAIEKRCTHPLSQKEMDEFERNTVDDDYLRWCNERVFFLNFVTEIPHQCERYSKDDLTFDLDDKHNWLLDDIIHTFAYCRHSFYMITEGKESHEICWNGRDERVERMIDCFVRLYTLLDKTSKLIIYLFPEEDLEINRFYDVAEHYRNSSNPYLRSFDLIKDDIFPDRVKNQRSYDPRNSVLGIVTRRGFIRNNIIHGTVKICDDREVEGNYYGVLMLTPEELFHYTRRMLYDVREILLNLQLAYNYEKYKKG